jgi:hypothetical protein
MWSLSIAFILLAAVSGYWLRRATRSRAGEIPCTSGAMPVMPALLSVCVILGMASGSGLLISHFHWSGSSAIAYVAWMIPFGAASLLFVLALAAAHTNRVAMAWLSLTLPNALIIRTPAETTRVLLEKKCVRAFVVGNGMGGPTYVQYFIEVGERTLNLVVPYSLGIGSITDGAPWLAQYVGLVVQSRAREIHHFLEPFCTRDR